jgi:uncharacterized protein YoxC
MENEILQQIVNKLDYVEKKLEKLDKLEQDVAEMKQDYRRLNQSVAALEKEVRHDFKIICENSGDWNERNRQVDRLEKTLEDHHDRIWALGQVVKAEYS